MFIVAILKINKLESNLIYVVLITNFKYINEKRP